MSRVVRQSGGHLGQRFASIALDSGELLSICIRMNNPRVSVETAGGCLTLGLGKRTVWELTPAMAGSEDRYALTVALMFQDMEQPDEMRGRGATTQSREVLDVIRDTLVQYNTLEEVRRYLVAAEASVRRVVDAHLPL